MNYKVNSKYQWIFILWLIALIYLSALVYIKLPFIGLEIDPSDNNGLFGFLNRFFPKWRIETQVYNLQILVVWMSGVIGGPILGSIAALVYLISGISGLPVFSGGGGFDYIQEPTFGYLLSLPLLAYLSGKLYSPEKKVLPVFVPIFTAHMIGILYLIIFKSNYIDIAWSLSFSMIGYDLIFAFILAPFMEIFAFLTNEMFIKEVPSFNAGQA